MRLILSTTAALILTASVSFAQMTTEMTKEERTKAAELHEKMAGCLRSDKGVQACHDEVKGTCADADTKACNMMGYGRGKMHSMMGKLKAKTNAKKEEVKQETK